ncbi:hypothetical protein [Empedobacter brevis]|uniref:hypothetical protein n=1 Tax=Empedobacter brevis TaxID=247 RepID=UPI0039AFE7F1
MKKLILGIALFGGLSAANAQIDLGVKEDLTSQLYLVILENYMMIKQNSEQIIMLVVMPITKSLIKLVFNQNFYIQNKVLD